MRLTGKVTRIRYCHLTSVHVTILFGIKRGALGKREQYDGVASVFVQTIRDRLNRRSGMPAIGQGAMQCQHGTYRPRPSLPASHAPMAVDI